MSSVVPLKPVLETGSLSFFKERLDAERKKNPDLNPVIKHQLASLQIWEQKYKLKSKIADVDNSIQDTYQRIARALSEVEPKDKQSFYYEEFLTAIEMGAIPAGRIVANAFSKNLKSNVSLINCTVSGIIHDNMESILENVKQAGLTLKSGAGIGYEFSTLRPRGAFVSGVGATTNGPLSFMDIFDSMCLTISSAGGRRGAQMATMDIHHPDVEEFITAKRKDGRLRHFNLSLLITNNFIEAVKEDREWKLSFPISERDEEFLSEQGKGIETVWRTFPVKDNYTVNDEGKILCRVYKTIKAKYLWDLIMKSTYDFAEPGFILIDKVNEMNNNWWCENIRTTNPCSEQPLPQYGSCLLGSINLIKFVVNPFSEKAYFDYEAYGEVVKVFTRMLDNVVELNGLVLEKQREEIIKKRRHGMGFMGLGSSMAMLGIRYGCEESVAFTKKVTKILALEGWREGVELAKEKGQAPIFEQDTLRFVENPLPYEGENIQEAFDHTLDQMESVASNISLFCLSPYMRRVFNEDKELEGKISKHGVRFTHHSSIAPTGTISSSLGNNISNGIEPSYSHEYYRNMIVSGKKTKEQLPVRSYEYLVWLARNKLPEDSKLEDIKLPDYMATTNDLTPDDHLLVQAAAQEWIDSSISKTINVPTDYPFENFQNIYMKAVDLGLKGCTTFRFNPEAFQGVLVNKEDLKNTVYTFKLADGTEREFRGDEEIMYDGEVHIAANLYDALKEGFYGRY